MRKIAVLYWLLGFAGFAGVSTPAFAACPPAQLQQAFFSLSPDQGNPVSHLGVADIGNHRTLYFFSRVSGNTTDTLLHDWRHDDQQLPSTRLQNGVGSWQSWSAQPLGKDVAGTWQVDIRDGHHCLLGRVSLTITEDDSVLQKARQLLSHQDVTGAKILLKQALSKPDISSAQRQSWQDFMDQELVLAEVENNIAQQQWIAAEGRLQSLDGQLDGTLAVRYQQLQQQLAKALRDNEQSQLFTLMAAIHSLAISQTCPTNLAAAQTQLASLLPDDAALLGGFTRNGTNIHLTVTLSSGTARSLDWPCQPLLALPERRLFQAAH